MTTRSRQRPILDWKAQHDPRSRAFPVRATLGQPVAKRQRLWKPGVVLDQGSEGACVGFGWVGDLIASPRRSEVPLTTASGSKAALSLYKRAQVLDDFSGEAYSGTSVLAGAKACVEAGYIAGYRWAFGIDDVRSALIVEGPVVIGIPWYESMYETAADYEVIVDGEQVGGHCILLTGYHPAHPHYEGREMFRWRNSWGLVYGNGGSAWIDAGDLTALLADGGEACVPEGRRTVRL